MSMQTLIGNDQSDPETKIVGNLPRCKSKLYSGKPDALRRRTILRALAEKDDNVQFQAGLLYLNPSLMRPNHAKAATWFQKSARNGNAQAQYNLGLLHMSGKGVKKDMNIALHWFTLAAKGGVVEVNSKP